MFAVKGWAVDASALKPQTTPFPSSAAKKAADDAGGQQNEGSKKRKRGSDPDPAAVTSEEVEKLWSQHIEGKKPADKKKEKKKERKRAKVEGEAHAPERAEVAEQKKGKHAETQKEQVQATPEKGAAGEKKAKKDKSKKNKDRPADGAPSAKEPAKAAVVPPKAPASIAPAVKLTPMQAAMRQKLISARFRHLNETLYTEPSAKSLELFAENPEMFEDYHSGFRQQVAVWPENPVDSFVATIRTRGGVRLMSQKKAFRDKKRAKEPEPTVVPDRSILPLPRTQGTCIIADLGCGDARLAHTFKSTEEGQKLQLKILSYDLHSPSPLVTKADIANVPAADGSVDVAIFCLALMGTNWIAFIEEAYRILHWKGELWIAEIKSRFGRIGKAGRVVEHSVGGKRKQAALKKAQDAKKREADDVNEQQALAVEVDGVPTENKETDVSAFVDVLQRRGFVLKNGESSIDLSNKMFVRMEFIKAATPTKGKGVPQEAPAAQPRFKKQKAKFLDEDTNDVATDDEAKVLKPCLYKIR